MFRKKKFIVPAIIIIVLVSYFLFFRNNAVKVKEIKLPERKVQRTVSASGTVTSVNEAELSFTSTGNIYSFNVKEGEEVSEGYFLASLDNYADSQTLQSVKDARDIALRDRELFIENYETNKGALGGEDEYDISLRRQNELVSKAEAAYQAQLGTVGKTYIYSPFEGTIIDIYKKEGETAAIGQSIIKIADLNKLIFEIELDQEDYKYVKEGMEVEIQLDAYEGESFVGTVAEMPKYVAGDADFELKIGIDEQYKDKILLGMTGDAFIILAETENEVPVLSFDEIFYDLDDKPYVFVEKEGKAQKLYIETGLQGDIYVEIDTDMTDPVIMPLTDKVVLEEGTPVNLVAQ